MSLVATNNKRTLSLDIISQYQSLTRKTKGSFREVCLKKDPKLNKARLYRLFYEQKIPTPFENEYLSTVVKFFYDYENGNETMSFETLQNL